jgi:hypothetical protein
MGRDLKDRVRRGVNDPRPGGDVLGRESLDHIGAAAGDVADDTTTGQAGKLVDHGRRKACRVSREGIGEANARQLPMAGRRVLSG